MEPIRDVQVGDDQVQLINYFSQALVNQHNPILEPTVTKLLESYKSHKDPWNKAKYKEERLS
ncbi:hypothetical protein PGTUg99_005320 [Puccinia graminis f. sp. tritici]|uniref:Uncharacterized protein n=1 Tax=Puccinia graminis f. sp. tritici TaxID=56615 RepID=A0A5B0QDM1_PUCGR|nr:hypothetical protein PGTUg99_005320 [Puccinia graminis f. sp. tritici]